MKQKNVANFFLMNFLIFWLGLIMKKKPGQHFWVPPLGTPSRNHVLRMGTWEAYVWGTYTCTKHD